MFVVESEVLLSTPLPGLVTVERTTQSTFLKHSRLGSALSAHNTLPRYRILPAVFVPTSSQLRHRLQILEGRHDPRQGLDVFSFLPSYTSDDEETGQAEQ